jgi:predicted metalloprotease
MEFDDQNVDVSGVDDQRGRTGGLGRGPMVAGGGGIVAVIVTVLIMLLGGGGGSLPTTGALDQGTGTSSGVVSDLKTRCNTAGAIDTYDDCYLVKVYNETNEVWAAEFNRLGESFRQPTLTFYDGYVQTSCGAASAQVGPFYCPADEHIYIDIGFLSQLQEQVGAQGRYAQAYILAHEYGHHLQTVLGIESQVRRAQQANPSQANALSVRMELQADCLAGVWGNLANAAGNVTISASEAAQAQSAAAAVGDDRLQAQSGGPVNQETWTHGSAKQRQTWYTTGFQSGDLNRCNTFSS